VVWSTQVRLYAYDAGVLAAGFAQAQKIVPTAGRAAVGFAGALHVSPELMLPPRAARRRVACHGSVRMLSGAASRPEHGVQSHGGNEAAPRGQVREQGLLGRVLEGASERVERAVSIDVPDLDVTWGEQHRTREGKEPITGRGPEPLPVGPIHDGTGV